MTGDLGFKGIKNEDYSDFAPRLSDVDVPIPRDAGDHVAERAGFRSREAVERVRRVPKSKEPMDQAYIRGSVSLINRFKIYCNEEGLTYGEALERLMTGVGIKF